LKLKLNEEKVKFDTLLNGRLEIEEKLKRKAEKMADDKVAVGEQELKL
jgi:hypothetical protein